MLIFIKSAARRGFVGFCLVGLLVGVGGWLLCVTMLGHYIGQRYPLYPGLAVSHLSFVLDMAPFAVLFGLFAAGIAAAIPNRKWRYIALGLVFTLGLHSAGDFAAFMVQIDGGATWGPGEAFRTFIWHPLIYPAVNIGGLVILWLAYKRG